MNTDIIICLVASIAINIGIAIFVICRLGKIKRVIKDQKSLNQTNHQQNNSQLNNQTQVKRESFHLSESDKYYIIEEVCNCIRLDEEEKQKRHTIKEELLEKESKVSNIKFPPPITKTGFPDNLSDKQNDSYFRFFDIEGNKANFDFCGNNIERAIANKVEIEQACEIVSIDSESSKVENLEKGTVVLRDGKWEVTIKAKIKFV